MLQAIDRTLVLSHNKAGDFWESKTKTSKYSLERILNGASAGMSLIPFQVVPAVSVTMGLIYGLYATTDSQTIALSKLQEEADKKNQELNTKLRVGTYLVSGSLFLASIGVKLYSSYTGNVDLEQVSNVILPYSAAVFTSASATYITAPPPPKPPQSKKKKVAQYLLDKLDEGIKSLVPPKMSLGY